MTPTSTCMNPTCNTVTPGTVRNCPACGRKTMSSRRIVVLGWVLLVIGLGLAGGMAMIFRTTYPSMSHPGVPDAGGTTFSGTPEQAQAALQLFLGVFGFGVLATLNGIWQIATGRRSLIFAALTVAVAGAIFFGARSMMAPGGAFAG